MSDPETLTHDAVREKLRDLVQTLGPHLADAVLKRRDDEYIQGLAVRVDAAAELTRRFEREVEAHPETPALLLLKAISDRAATERPPEAPKGPSIWELLQKPAL